VLLWGRRARQGVCPKALGGRTRASSVACSSWGTRHRTTLWLCGPLAWTWQGHGSLREYPGSEPAVGVPRASGKGWASGVARRLPGGLSRPQDVRAAVAAALQCSDFRRRTALHVAVERDDVGLLLALVRCAAGCSGGPAAQDRGRAPTAALLPRCRPRCGERAGCAAHDPLFAAAEQGYTSAVEVSDAFLPSVAPAAGSL